MLFKNKGWSQWVLILLFSVYRSLYEFMNKKCIHGIIFWKLLTLLWAPESFSQHYTVDTVLSAGHHSEGITKWKQTSRDQWADCEKYNNTFRNNILVASFPGGTKYLLWNTFLFLPLCETWSHFCFWPSHQLFESKPLDITANAEVTHTVTEAAFVEALTHSHIWLITVKPWWNCWIFQNNFRMFSNTEWCTFPLSELNKIFSLSGCTNRTRERVFSLIGF